MSYETRTFLPPLHVTRHRVTIEVLDGWSILGEDRRSLNYEVARDASATPIQLARLDRNWGFISLISPCTYTQGRFETYCLGKITRFCCARCATKWFRTQLELDLPPLQDWIVYMLMESNAYFTNPNAPQELP